MNNARQTHPSLPSGALIRSSPDTVANISTDHRTETAHPFCLFTVATPTFNRAHTLPRAYESLQRQSFRDFEWLIVDDGSTDDTRTLVHRWQEEADFPIRYYWQENQGKHVAHNTAAGLARGELTVILDSDDQLVDDALERLRGHWEAIPPHERSRFAGVEGLAAYLDGEIEGTPFPKDVLDSDYIEIRGKYGVTGDKKGAIRTDLLRAFPFPHFPGEKHIRPSLLWRRLSCDYTFRFINEVIQLKELQPGGLSSDRFRLRMNNPRGFRYYYREEVNRYGERNTLRQRLDSCAKYVRFSLHSGIGYRQQCREIDAPWLWFLSIPKGTLVWLRDRVKMRRDSCR